MTEKCCNEEDNLDYGRSSSIWPYEVWYCKKCDKEWNVELIRDFENKEER